MKVEIEIDELAGCKIVDDDNNTIEWNNLSRIEQIRILNSFVNFYTLFKNFLKDE